MRIAWATDTHLNMSSLDDVIEFSAKLSRYDASIITGDISDFPNLEKHLRMLSSSGTNIWVVGGNHDAYGASIKEMRKVFEKCASSGPVRYLHNINEPIRLTSKTVLIGVDGWYDGRNGNYQNSHVRLNDFYVISELVGDKNHRLTTMMRLSDESANLIEKRILDSISTPGIENIIIATHVPPFVEASWHKGKQSNDDFSPFFSNKSVGEAIMRASADTNIKITVLCGHTHSPGTIRKGNVVCHTGYSDYGHPDIFKVIDIP